MRTSIALLSTCLLTACASEDQGNGFYGSGGNGSAGTSDGEDPGEDPGTSDGTDGDDDDDGDDGDGDTGADDGGGPLFDVGDGMGTAGDDGGADLGCRGIDFLFVIDNSASMAEEQLNVINSFPGFVSGIQDTLDDKARDFNVMVVDTDWGETMNPPAASGTCEAELGTGIVTNPSHYPCGIPDGRRFMTSDDANLPSAFGCTAQLGTQGNAYERPMESMMNAIGPHAEPGQCNEGFLREDAILVVTFITDEEEKGSMGDPAMWRDALIDAKGGDPDAVVLLGLFGDPELPSSPCEQGESIESPRLNELIGYFGDHALRGSVCADDYSPFFVEAIDVIEQSCSDWQPPG